MYLGLSPTQHVDHDLHDRLVHAQRPHQVGVLVEDLVVHDVPGGQEKSVRNRSRSLKV